MTLLQCISPLISLLVLTKKNSKKNLDFSNENDPYRDYYMNIEFRKDEFVQAYHEDGAKWRVIMRHIYSEWKPGIVKHIVISGGSAEDAEDVFQDGMVEFVTNILQDRFREQSSLKTYLTVICKYMWFSRYKKANRRAEILDQIVISKEEENSLDFVIYAESTDILQGILDQLGERCRELLTLWSMNFRFREIVQKMNFPTEEAARKKKFECLKKLVELLRREPKLKEELRSMYYE